MLGPVTYQISQDDFLAFSRLSQVRYWRRHAGRFIFGLAILMAIFALLLRDLVAGFGGAVFGLIGFAALWLVSFFIIQPRQAGKTYKQHRLIQEEMTLSISDEGFSISQTSGNVKLPWNDVVLWNENDTILVLHPTEQLGYIFPKAQIGAEHAEFIRNRLALGGLPDKAEVRK